MKFGRGPFEESFLEDYDFQIAEVRSTELNLRVGLPQWAVAAWKGALYPLRTSPTNFLLEYGKRLDSVEVSSTFYADVGPERLKIWADSVPASFRFLPKWPQRITHEKGLRGCDEELRRFCSSVEVMQEKLGTTILQLPPSFSRSYSRELHGFLCQVPEGFPVAIEFRHADWFQNGRLYDRLADFLRNRGISSVISDTPGRRDACHLSFTGPHNIVRYLSDENLEMDEKRLLRWREWLNQKPNLGDLSFILHRPNNDRVPELLPFFSPQLHRQIEESLEAPQRALF